MHLTHQIPADRACRRSILVGIDLWLSVPKANLMCVLHMAKRCGA